MRLPQPFWAASVSPLENHVLTMADVSGSEALHVLSQQPGVCDTARVDAGITPWRDFAPLL